MKDELEKLVKDSEEATLNLRKETDAFLKGNKAAGARLRKEALILHKTMKEIRLKTSEIINS